MADYNDPLDAAKKRPTPIGQSYFPAVDRMIRGGALAQGWSNQELLGRPETRYFGETGLMNAGAYSPTMFDPNYRPEISPRTGQGLLTPMYRSPTPSSFFPGVRFPGGTYRPKLAQNERGDLLRDIDATFYGGGNAPAPTPTPTPTTSPRFRLGMYNPDWASQYGWGA